MNDKMNDHTSKLPILEGNEARTIDLNVTEQLGRVRVLEQVATRIADALQYHLLPSTVLFTDENDKDTTEQPPQPPSLLFVAGKGNNGANAIATARILSLRGFAVILVPLFDVSSSSTTTTTTLRPNIQEQLDLYKEFVENENDRTTTSTIYPYDYDMIRNYNNGGIIIDGILGTGIDRPPHGPSKHAIDAIVYNNNYSQQQQQQTFGTKVLSIDIPSGLNHITGIPPDDSCAVKATWTLNLHMLKRGQLTVEAKPYIGELWSAESGLGFTTFPKHLIPKFQSLYNKSPIVRVNVPPPQQQQEGEQSKKENDVS